MLPMNIWPRSQRQIYASDALVGGAQSTGYENLKDHSQRSFQDQEAKGRPDALNVSRAHGVTGEGG